MRRRNNAAQGRDMARQRMERLFELASLEHPLHPERSHRYVQVARKISTRMRIRMPAHLKSRFCKHCGCYLSPSEVTIRLRKGILTHTCTACSGQWRRPYKT